MNKKGEWNARGRKEQKARMEVENFKAGSSLFSFHSKMIFPSPVPFALLYLRSCLLLRICISVVSQLLEWISSIQSSLFVFSAPAWLLSFISNKICFNSVASPSPNNKTSQANISGFQQQQHQHQSITIIIIKYVHVYCCLGLAWLHIALMLTPELYRSLMMTDDWKDKDGDGYGYSCDCSCFFVCWSSYSSAGEVCGCGGPLLEKTFSWLK